MTARRGASGNGVCSARDNACMSTFAGSFDAAALPQRVTELRGRIDAAPSDAPDALLPEVNRLIGDIQAERSRDQLALDRANETFRTRFGTGQRIGSRLNPNGPAAQYRRSVIDPLVAEVKSDDTALASARRLKNIGSSDYWYNGQGRGSATFWYNGRGPGSANHWYRGEGPGSAAHWYRGEGPGSAAHWYRGEGPGSAAYWYRGTGPGSSHFWYRGPDADGPGATRMPPWLIAVIREHVESDD